MNIDAALDIIRICLWEGIYVCAPIVLGALVIGLGISILQSITTIQETSLSFVPKLLWAVAGTWIFAPFMLAHLRQLTTTLFQRAAEIAR
ncbi:MAG: flagellar biosynthetic protein FliQ [Verrucomicrobium sp.]|nr:flagellar biosynthetic protein FliQ [Verrucomicrobium sp.]